MTLDVVTVEDLEELIKQREGETTNEIILVHVTDPTLYLRMQRLILLFDDLTDEEILKEGIVRLEEIHRELEVEDL